MFTIYSGNKSLQHIVDTFHLPLLVSHPHWGCQWDTDFDKAVATRRKIVRQGAEQGTPVFILPFALAGSGVYR